MELGELTVGDEERATTRHRLPEEGPHEPPARPRAAVRRRHEDGHARCEPISTASQLGGGASDHRQPTLVAVVKANAYGHGVDPVTMASEDGAIGWPSLT